MAVLPFLNADGTPSKSAVYVNALLSSALYNDFELVFDHYTRIFGGNVEMFSANPDTFEPDAAIIKGSNDALVVLNGTTNYDQWLSHIGSSWWPSLDGFVPIIGGGTPFAFGSCVLGLNNVQTRLDDILYPLGGHDINLTGHSYGAGCSFMYGRRLANATVRPPRINVMTFGEMKVYDGRLPVSEVDSHIRIIGKDFDSDDPTSAEKFVDPVTLLPPGQVMFQALKIFVKIATSLSKLSLAHWGESWLLGPYGLQRGAPYTLRTFPVIETATILADVARIYMHLIDSWYLRWAHDVWQRSGEHRELRSFEPFYAIIQRTPFVPPNALGPSVSAAVLNQSYFGKTQGPVTDATRPLWESISASGIFVSNAGGSNMATQMKGTFEFVIGEAGFSESIFANPNLGNAPQSHAAMMNVMKQLMPLRAKLSVCGTYVTDQNPISFETLRVEDVNQKRAVLNFNPYNPQQGWVNQPPVSAGAPNVYAANLPEDNAARVVFSNGAGLNAAVYLHGIPIGGVVPAWPTTPPNAAFFRQAAMNPVWLNYLAQYSDAITNYGCGFRNLLNIWTDPPTGGLSSKPVSVSYDTVNEQYQIVCAQAPPPGRNRYVLRGWKNLPFLNGRWTGVTQPGNIVVIQRKLRQVTWDTENGTICPLTWGYYSPVPSVAPGPSGPGVQFFELTSKKVGRPFEQQRGRRRNTVT